MANNKKDRNQRQSLTGIINDISFSDNDVWLWVKIPASQYEFRDYGSRERLAVDFDLALANLVTSDEKALECQLLVSSKEFDSILWARRLFDRAKRNQPSDYFGDFLTDMHDRVERIGFRGKLVMLGLKLGTRAEYSATRVAFNLGPINDLVTAFSGTPDEYMSDKEFKFWDTRAKSYRNSLYGSRLRAEAVAAEDIAYVTRKPFFPGMPSPDEKELSLGNSQRWGIGEVGALFDAEIENNPRWLKISQIIEGEEVTGYRATLCFNKFPEVMNYPDREPWIHYAASLPFNTDFYSRFTLEPSRKVRKEVDRKLKEMEDQARNQVTSGNNVSMQVSENLQLGKELDYVLGKDTTPWVFGRHRIIVEGRTEDELKERAQAVIDHYKALDIFVVWPTGDQLNLLCESLPNDRVRLKAYYQRQELSILSAGVPAGSGTAGDSIVRENGEDRGWLGPYIGYTTGYTVEPVFFAPHTAPARNFSPGTVITGSPGAGKSFTAFTIAYEMALQGVWTIYIDPKADAIPMMQLPGMEKARLLDLKTGNDGILDPFSIGTDDSEKLELAMETITLLMGGYAALRPEARTALSAAIEWVMTQQVPSLSLVVDYLQKSEDAFARALGTDLNIIRRLPFARLAFAPRGGQTLRPDAGLTVITLLGLDLPPAQASMETYSGPNRLAVAVMYLLTSFTRQLMIGMNKSHPKAIMIDEAWAITSTKQGQKMVLEVARMGRSLNTTLTLVSQNAGDFLDGQVLNSVSTKMAFRSQQPEEIDNILKFFNLEPTEGNKDTIRSLRNGECIMQDPTRRIARVQIDGWNENMREAFETNPETRKNQA